MTISEASEPVTSPKLSRRKWLLIAFIIMTVYSAWFYQKPVEFLGQTMGTTYQIKAYLPLWKSPENIQHQIQTRLQDINTSLSTYDPTSEISKFNQQTTLEPIQISTHFNTVLQEAIHIHQQTQGAFEPTVMPLLKAWGFQTETLIHHPPDQESLNCLLGDIGLEKLSLDTKNQLKKHHPNLHLDLSAIAKGYGVDELGSILKDNGSRGFLVEIGGELLAYGTKMNGEQWRVGVNTPDPNKPVTDIFTSIQLDSQAMATSGTYRNTHTLENTPIHHIIDPKTGHPVDNSIVSVTIIADTCIRADALATAILVLGETKGLELIETLQNTECLIISQDEGTLHQFRSRNFPDTR